MTHDEIDNVMQAAFEGVQPDANFEERLVVGFREARRSRPLVIHPMVRRAAVGVAAAILLGGVGFLVTSQDDHGRPKANVFSARVDLLTDGAVNQNAKHGTTASLFNEAPGFSLDQNKSNGNRQSGGGGPQGLFGGFAVNGGKDVNDRFTNPPELTPSDMSHQLAKTLDVRFADSSTRTAMGEKRGEAKIKEPRQEIDVKREPSASAQVNAPVAGPTAAPVAVSGQKPASVLRGSVSDGNEPGLKLSGGQLGSGDQTKDASRYDYYYSVQQLGDNQNPQSFNFGTNVQTPAGSVALGDKSGLADSKSVAAVADGIDAEKAPNAARFFRPADVAHFAKNAAPHDQADAAMLPTVGFDFDADKNPSIGKKLGDTQTLAYGDVEDLGVSKPPAGRQKMPAKQGQKSDAATGGKVPALAAANTDAPAQKPPASTPAQQQQPSSAKPEEPAAPESRQVSPKIIRNGEMNFEVDSYDSSVVQITKIAGEEGGFISTTQSEKLPNGKVRGSVVVRVPPDRLDTLVLKLRGLGDLKNSKISAQDITKQYTDLDSQLRAAKAMQERLLEIIKTGKGNVKELLEAEKQLGSWREKIEGLEGEIRYYNNLISLSTLNVSLAERDIRTSALLSETEQVNMGLEADDVEKARAAAIKTIDDAKGRIVESNLKKLDAGQFSAVITADISPDAAGPAIDRLKQLGRVARLEVQRHQTTAEGTGSPAPGARVERKDTRLLLSIYNLANIAPRNSTSLQLASDDVEKAYRDILKQVESAGGRVTSSQLTKPTPEQTTGVISFESPTAAADVLLGAVRGVGEVMRLDTNINPDTQNVTDAKRGFTVQIRSLATVPPRETTALRLASRDVSESFSKLRDAVRSAGGRILTSQLVQQDKNNVSGQLDFEAKRENLAATEAALAEAGVVLSRNVNRSSDTQNTVDSKVLLQVAFVDEKTAPARESIVLQLAVDDVATKYDKLLEVLRDAGARVTNSQIDQHDPTHSSASVEIDTRKENRPAVEKALADAGGIYGRTIARPGEGQAAIEDKVHFNVTMNDVDNLPPRETTTIGIESNDVAGAAGSIEASAISLGGRKVDSDWAQEPGGQTIARVVVDVPYAKADELVSKVQGSGRVLSVQRDRTPGAPEGAFARARLSVTVAANSPIQGDQTLGGSIRSGLSVSVQWLLKSVSWIVIGLCLVAPWMLIGWVGWKMIRRKRQVATTV